MKLSFLNKHKLVNIILLIVSVVILAGLSYGLWKEIRLYSLEKDIYDRDEKLVIESEKKTNYSVIKLANVYDEIDKYFIVDVREKEEFDQGRLMGAQNFRLGDILSDNSFQKIILENSENKKILFFCHNGERSKIAADFLGSKSNNIFYVTEHAFEELRSSDELSEKIWKGTLKRVLPKGFWEDLKDRGYKIDNISEIETNLIVDVTTESIDIEEKLNEKEVIYAPIVKMPSSEVFNLLENIGDNSFSVICDSKLSCFYAKVLAYRSENSGGKFKGYYLWK